MSAFDDDFAAADSLFAEVFGQEATIVRGSSSTSGVTVQMLTRNEPIDGLLPTRMQMADWLVAAEEYRIGGAAVTPRDGDRLAVEIGGVSYLWELLPTESRPCYEWGDGSRQNWIVHTKYVGTGA